MKKSQSDLAKLEFKVDLLKERIYATLALFAVLVSIDSRHTTSLRAALIVGGTAFSLWLASIVAAQMSYRIVMQHRESSQEAERHLLRHAPLLIAAIFPLLFISMSALGVITLATALNIAIGSSILLMLSWSLLSARALQTRKLPTIIVALIELVVGLAIVILKAKLGH